MTARDGVLAWLNGQSTWLFLIAGTMFLIAAANNAVIHLVDGYTLTVVSGVGLLLGLLAALLGVAGLYPPLRTDTPRLAQFSLGVGAVGLLGIMGMIVWRATNPGVAPSPLLAIGSLVMIVAGFCLFSGAVIRTDSYPSVVGILLLTEAAALFSVFAIPALTTGDPPDWGLPLIEGIQAVLLLGIGYFLRRDAASFTPGESTTTDRSIT
jgi:hypothetical protein